MYLMMFFFVNIPEDRNECTEAPCHTNASCINTVGSFYCDCKPGFLGDGLECEGKCIPKSHSNSLRLNAEYTRYQ